MTSRFVIAAALAATLAAAPALAQTVPAPAPAPPAPTTPAPANQGSQRPGVAPGTHPGPTISGQPTPMPNLTFEEIVGDIPANQTLSPSAIAIGAVAGVIIFNMLTPTLFPATYMTGGPLVGTIVADTAVSASRIYAISSAAIGGWTGQWIYSNWLTR